MRVAPGASWRPPILALVIAALLQVPIGLAKAGSYLEEAQAFLQKGDIKSALIQLKNAARETPDDAKIRAQLADLYLRTGDLESAVREARAARERKGDEADYLPVLADALLRQGKFADLLGQVTSGDRAAPVESKIRLAIGMAELGLHRQEKAEPALRDAVRLDPQSTKAKLVLAQFLAGKDPNEADRVVEEVLAADSRSVEAIQVKGIVLQARGDREGAMRRFDEAIKIDPQNRSARLSRAALNIRDRDFTAADGDLDPILKANPNDVQANLLRAQELAGQKQYAKADELLERLSSGFEMFWQGYYLQGVTKFELGQYAQADSLLGKYIGRMPQDTNAIRLAAIVALRLNNPSKAIRYLKPLADKAPADAAILGLLGNAYIATGKPDLALEQFQKAAVVDPDEPNIQTNVALAEMRTGKGKEGLAELERIFESEPGMKVAGTALVLAELRTGQIDKAAAAAAKLVKYDPGNFSYQTLLGMVRNRQGDIAGAEAAFRAAVDLQPESGAMVANLARLYIVTGRVDEATKVYQNFLAKHEADVMALRGLAEVAATQKKWDQAAEYLNRAQTAAPNDPSPSIQLVDLYLLRGNPQRAKAMADQLAIQFNTNPSVLDARGRAQIAIGDNSGAVSTYKSAYQLAPNSGPIISRYVSLLVAAKNFSEARIVLQEVVGRNPANATLKIALLRVEAQAGNVDAAIAKARSFAQADPDSARYDLVAAELYEKAGRKADAQQVLEKAVAARPDTELAVALANFYSRLGEYAKSEGLLKSKLQAEPDNVSLHFALASVYQTDRKLGEAIGEYERTLAINPKHVGSLNNIAWSYQQQGDLAKARNFAEQALLVAPQAGEIQDTLGWILLAQGETEPALIHLKAASTTMPHNTSVQYHWAVALGRSGKSAEARSVLEKLLASGGVFDEKAEAEKLFAKLKYD